MKAAGLITFHFANHYGAQLQAYATMRAVEQLGTPCELIDYRLPHTTQTNRLYRKGMSPKTLLINGHTLLHHKALRRRNERFAAFVTEKMHCSKMQYESNEALRAAPPVYDLYIAGSDQIWSPSIFANGRFDPAFFLTFATEGRKISYASSFGGTSIPESMEDELEQYLQSFDAVSARETRTQEILEHVMDQKVPTVLDPTLLLTGETWGEIAVPPQIEGPYILCYFISDYSNLLPYLQELKEKTGYPVIQLAGMRRRAPGTKKIVLDAGPQEFLGLFQHAAYVLTNSFHGTVFSLQFEKPFFTAVSPKEQKHPEQSRIYHLLNLVGQTGRIVGLEHTVPIEEAIDYGSIRKRMAEEREHSLSFLRNNLEAADPKRWTSERDVRMPRKKVRLAGRDQCTGCSACQAACPMGCITMEVDEEGFLRPLIGDTCIRCRTCETVCPVLKGEERKLSFEPRVYAAWVQNKEIKKESTSGGVFSALASHVLKKGGVVYGAAFDEMFHLSHVCVEKEEELFRLRSTKYVQSDLGRSFNEIKDLLDLGKTVLFSGTPCQVDGLRHYLREPYEKLILCDLVCHGVPSPGVWEKYVGQMEADAGSAVASVSFRDKEDGWTRARFVAQFENGTQWAAPLMKTPYGRGFGMALFLRPSCYHCQYTTPERCSDLTLGDFWGVSAKALPVSIRMEDGVSLVLSHTEKGQALLDAVDEEVSRVERSLQEAIEGNPRLKTPIEMPNKRSAFFEAFQTQPFEEVSQTFLRQPSLLYRIGAKILGPGIKQKIRKWMKK